MIVKPKVEVTGLTIELTIAEALQMAQDPARVQRVRDEARAVLSASGIDPDTGERKDSVLGLKAALPAPAGDGSPAFRRLDGSHPARDEEPEESEADLECPDCGKVLKTKAGVKIHQARFCPAKEG